MALLLAFAAAAPVFATPVRLDVESAGGPGAAVCTSATLRLSPQSSKPAPALPASVETTVGIPGQKVVDLAEGLAWRLEAVAPGCWSKELLLAPGTHGEPVVVRLFPTGTLKARFTSPRGEPLPKEIAVRFNAAPAGPGGKAAASLPEATVTCPVREGGWECALPAGALDLRLKGEALVPVYRWGVEVAAGKSRDLGEIHLVRGASVSGFVELAERGAPPAGCRIELAPFSAGTPSDRSAYERRNAATLSTQTDARGFFQLGAVPPGAYRVTASREGFAPAQRSPVVVRSDLESQLVAALTLARPVTLAVDLDPGLDPYGRPWRLELFARDPVDDHHAEQVFAAAASAAGHLEKKGIAPGSYRLDVVDEQRSRWLSQEVQVGQDGAALALSVPVLEIRGSVTLGGDPLAATVWLGGAERQRLRFDADEKGRFEGYLPKPGSWTVEVASESAGLRLVLDPVEVTPPHGKRFSEIEIRVPDTTLEGRVLDESGQAVGNANLATTSLASQEHTKGFSRFRADAEGHFKVRGLPVGQTAVQAQDGDRSSDWVNVTLDEGHKAPQLDLVVRRARTLEGRVSAGEGAVPGALVLGWPDLVEGATTFAQAVTGPDGSFKLELPAAAPSANLAIFPPGFAFRLLKVAIGGGAVDLQVDASGGTLVLAGGGKEDGGKPLTGMLVHGGAAMPIGLLGDWLRLQRAAPPSDGSGRLAVPNVESGEYSLCRGLLQAQKEGPASPALRCSSGSLAPFGELLLQAPPGLGG